MRGKNTYTMEKAEMLRRGNRILDSDAKKNIKQFVTLALLTLILILTPATASNIYSNQTIVLNGTGVKIIGGNLDAGNNRIANLGTPSAATDAAPRSYADSQLAGITIPAENVTPGTFPAGTYNFTGTATGNALVVNGTILVVNGTTGYVGINVTNPTHRLEIPAGRTRAQGIAFITGHDLYRENADVLGILTASSAFFNIVSGSLQIGGTDVITSGRLFRAADGSVSSPAYTFISDTDTGIYRAAADTLGIATAGANRITIDSIGNVGINTTTPGKTLSVNGDANITGTLTVGECIGCKPPAGAIVLWPNSTSNSDYTSTGYSIFFSQDSWIKKSDLNVPRSGLAAAAVNNKIYAFGGSSSSGTTAVTEEYDPTSDTWAIKTSMPTPRSYLAAGVANNTVYAIGGLNSTGRPVSTNEAYTAANDSWSTKANMSQPRSDLAAASDSDLVYVFGGYSGNASTCIGNVCNNLEVYNYTTNTWTSKASVPTPRYRLAGSSFNNTIYAIGGAFPSCAPCSFTFLYNTTANNWTLKEPMSVGLAYSSAAAVNNVVYVIGGYQGGSNLSSNFAYDTTTNTWTTKATMPTGRSGLVAANVNGIIYAISGSSGLCSSTFASSTLSSNEAYTPANDSWSAKTNMTGTRCGSAGAAVGDTIYIVGGSNSSQIAYSSVFAYNTTTDSWSSKTNITKTVGGGAGAAIGNVVYVIGGEYPTNCSDPNTNKDVCNYTYAYTTTNDSWSQKGSMYKNRRYHAAAALGDTVYVFGGDNATHTNISSAEAYNTTSSSWSNITVSMPVGNSWLSAAAVGNAIYTFGGWSLYCSSACDVLEAYTISNDSWSRKRDMLAADIYLASVAFNNSIYAIGGATSPKPSTFASYNPLNDVWSRQINMSRPRSELSSVVLNNSIYAIGGIQSSSYFGTDVYALNSTYFYMKKT